MKSLCFKIQLHSPYRTNIAENHPGNDTGTLVLLNLYVPSSRTEPSAKAGTKKVLRFYLTCLGKEKRK